MTKNTKRTLLDTNILVYASDKSSPFHKLAIELLRQDLQFFITDRSLLEFYRVVTGMLKISIQTTVDNINFYKNNPNYTILYGTDFSSQLAFKLAKDNQAISGKIFDLDILAIAIENELDYLFTKNVKDFPNNTSVKIVAL